MRIGGRNWNPYDKGHLKVAEELIAGCKKMGGTAKIGDYTFAGEHTNIECNIPLDKTDFKGKKLIIQLHKNGMANISVSEKPSKEHPTAPKEAEMASFELKRIDPKYNRIRVLELKHGKSIEINDGHANTIFLSMPKNPKERPLIGYNGKHGSGNIGDERYG